jgi:hypothetical protein
VWDNQKECRVGWFALPGFLMPLLRCTLWCGWWRSSWATLLEISVKGQSEGLKKIGVIILIFARFAIMQE